MGRATVRGTPLLLVGLLVMACGGDNPPEAAGLFTYAVMEGLRSRSADADRSVMSALGS